MSEGETTVLESRGKKTAKRRRKLPTAHLEPPTPSSTGGPQKDTPRYISFEDEFKRLPLEVMMELKSTESSAKFMKFMPGEVRNA